MIRHARARAWLPYAVAGTSGFLLAFLLVAVLLFPADDAPQEVRVPSVVGLPLLDAQRRLLSLGLTGVPGQERTSADAPPKSVVAQTPVPGETVNVGTKVVLDVSSGQPRATVPALLGLSRDDAEQQLRAAGLTAGDVREEVSDSARGTVLGAQPAPGVTVPLATRVGLLVSSGPGELSLPDVVGRSVDSARNSLEQLGLPVSVEYDSLSTSAAGTVVAQTPAAGAQVAGASAVTLRVSGKP